MCGETAGESQRARVDVSTARSGVCARSSWTAANKADKAGEMHSTATARSGVCAAGGMHEHSPLWGLCCDVPRGEVQFAVEVAVQVGSLRSAMSQVGSNAHRTGTARSGVCAAMYLEAKCSSLLRSLCSSVRCDSRWSCSSIRDGAAGRFAMELQGDSRLSCRSIRDGA
jgi:hypothetical protein